MGKNQHKEAHEICAIIHTWNWVGFIKVLGLFSGISLSSPSISRLKPEQRSRRESLTATFVS